MCPPFMYFTRVIQLSCVCLCVADVTLSIPPLSIWLPNLFVVSVWNHGLGDIVGVDQFLPYFVVNAKDCLMSCCAGLAIAISHSVFQWH